MALLADIREGLADRLKKISGLNTYDYIPSSITPPCAVVGGPNTVEYDQAMGRGLDRYEVPIRLYVPSTHDRAGQDNLDEYLASSGLKSVKARIEEDRTLAGAVADLRVTGITNYGRATYSGTETFSAELIVELYAQGA